MSLSSPAAHPARLEQLAIIGNTTNITWRAALVPQFAAHPPGRGVQLLAGLRSGWRERLAANQASGRLAMFRDNDGEAVPVPGSFDAGQNWPHCAKIIGDIRDQGNCGCCWAFVGAEVSSDRLCIATNGSLVLPISAQDVCFCSNEGLGCFGGDLDGPYFHVRDKGAVTGGQHNASGPFGGGFCSAFSLPHCHHHGPRRDDPYPDEYSKGCPEPKGFFGPACPTACDKDASAEHQDFQNDKVYFDGRVEWSGGAESQRPSEQEVQEQIMRMVIKGGPVSVGFTVYEDFENYVSGIYHHVHGNEVGGHAVKLVGWGVENGTKYWRLANSWNRFWGEGGYFRVKRGRRESCGIEDVAVAPSHSV